MSTIVCDELITTLTQTIVYNDDKLVRHIGGIKPRILMFNAPTGTFTATLKLGASELASQTFTSASIKTLMATTDNYAYLYVPLLFDTVCPIAPNTYTIVLSSSGYTYSGSSFIAWIKSFESIYITPTDAYISPEDNPMDILIYENVREDLIR